MSHIDPITVGLIGMGIFLLLLLLKMPIGFAMALVGFAGFAYLTSFSSALSKLAIVPYRAIASWDFFVVPLFVFMANVCLQFRFGEDLYGMTFKWMGGLRGGLAMATIVACAIFAAISGSSIGTALTVGVVALAEMKRYNYNRLLATGCVAAGGTLGIMIPPSNPMILYGIMTETSIGKLFIGGVIPGLIQATLFLITIIIVTLRRPDMAPKGPRTSIKEKIFSLKRGGEIILLILILLGGLFRGWFTPTEAGAVGAFVSLLIAILRGRFSWGKFKEACLETMRTTGMIYTLMIGALLMNYFLTVSKVPTELARVVGSLPIPPLGIMAMIMGLQIFLGCFIDALAMLLLLTPIFFPLALQLGFDPVWFGIMLTLMGEIAAITPPVGINVYVIKGVAEDVPMETIFKGAMLFFFADIVLVVLLLFFPKLALFLPSLMK